MLQTRRALVAGGLLLTALLVGVAGLVAVNRMASQTVREEHSYDFTGKALSIDASIGDVHIVPGKAGQITVARRLTYGLRRPYVEERVDGDTFRISDGPCTADLAFDCDVHWLLQVPRDIDVDVATRTGSINVSGMSNTVKVASDSGSVRVDAPSGKLVALRSRTGEVTAQNISSEQVVAIGTAGSVSLTFRTPPSLVVGRSDTGNVGIVLPDGDESYRIEAKSSQNGSRTVTAKDDPDSRRRINVLSNKGDVSVLQNPDRNTAAPG
jgi:Putative adhesin